MPALAVPGSHALRNSLTLRGVNVDLPSTKPYLIRAIHQWCCDNGFTPYLAVAVDARTRVPREHVRDGQIVLNVGYEATAHLSMDNDRHQLSGSFRWRRTRHLDPDGQRVGHLCARKRRRHGLRARDRRSRWRCRGAGGGTRSTTGAAAVGWSRAAATGQVMPAAASQRPAAALRRQEVVPSLP
jgi:hypothetical protein